MPLFSQGHALIIGVGHYDEPRWNVPQARNDAEALKETLIDPNLAAYPVGQVLMLLDNEATREHILDAFERLSRRVGPDDTILISFSGHGALNDKGLYTLASHDTVFIDGEKPIRSDTGFHVGDLYRALQPLQSRRVLLILNACLSGRATTSVLPNAPANKLLETGDGRAIITASRSAQVSYLDKNSSLSYFGQALIDGMRGAGATEPSGYIGLYELYQEIYQQVTTATAQLGLKQEPLLTMLQSAGPFPVGRYPGSATGPTSTPIQQQLSTGAVRHVTHDEIRATGDGAIAVKAESGSKVIIDQSKGVDFGHHNSFGDVENHNIAQGDIIINDPESTSPTEKDAFSDIDKYIGRIERLSGLDEDTRADSTHNLRQARSALGKNDTKRAIQRLEQARELLESSGHATAQSIARKISKSIQNLD